MKRCIYLKILVFSILLFCLTIPCHAADYKLFDSWVDETKTIDVEGDVFDISFEYYSPARENITKVGFIGEKEEIFVSGIECEIVRTHKFCLVEDRSPGWDYIRDVRILEARVTIYDITPVIEIKTEVTPEYPLFFDDVEIKTTFENSRSQVADFILYTAEFPPGILLKDVNASYAKIEGNKIIWNGEIPSFRETNIHYTIQILKPGINSIPSTIEYSFEGEEFIKTENINLSQGTCANITHSITNSEIQIGEEIEFTFTIRNKYSNKNLEITNLSVSIPNNLKVISTSEKSMAQLKNDLLWSGTIAGNSKKDFFVKFKGIKDSENNITIKMNHAKAGTLEVKTPEPAVQEISVDYSPVKIHTYLNGDDEKNWLNSGKSANLTVILENTNENVAFESINLLAESDLFEKQRAITQRIVKSGSWIALKFEIQIPNFEKSVNKSIKIEGNLKTEFGALKKFNKTLDIEVQDNNNLINIKKELSKTSVKPNETFIVTVWAKNYDDTRRTFSLEDFWPEGFIKEGGESKKTVHLSPNEEKIIYTFELRAPLKVSAKTAELSTKISSFYNETETEFFAYKTITLYPSEEPKTVFSRKLPENMSMGKIVNMTISTANSDARSLKNITIEFDSNPDYDIIGERTMFFDSVKTGAVEERIISIRPRKIGKITLPKQEIKYYDEYGNFFNKTLEAASFKAESGILESPNFEVNVETAVSSLRAGENLTVFITILNSGDDSAEVSIMNEHIDQSFTLASHGSISTKYILVFQSPGKYDIGSLDVKYSSNSPVFQHSVKPLTIIIMEKNSTIQSKPSPNTGKKTFNQIVEEEIIKIGNKEERDETKPQRNFIQSLAQAIAKLFNNLF